MNNFNKKQIIRNFNRAADDYDKCAILQKTVSERLISRLELVKQDPGRIVDVGSGTGKSAKQLANIYRKAKIIQLDMSFAMLRVARGRTPRIFSRHDHVCGDMEKLPLKDRCADMVFSSLTFQWCNYLDSAFHEIFRVLHPNGLLMFATLGPDTLKELRSSWAQVNGIAHVNSFLDMHDIGDALVRSGFENVVMDVEAITMQYQDCDTLMRDLKQVGAGNAHQGRSKGLTGKRLMEKMKSEYENFRVKGRLPATYEIVYGHAWKPLHSEQIRQQENFFISPDAIGGRHAGT